LEILGENPFQNQPRYEKLLGDLTGAYSRRITMQHRLVYQVLEKEHVVKVLRMWTHMNSANLSSDQRLGLVLTPNTFSTSR
jgi:Txe/YoeB family toxin of toxin-antitoxin system